MNSEDHIDALLRAAKNGPVPTPSTDLLARVLADAATVMPPTLAAIPVPKQRLFAPIGGLRGAFALAACAVFGVFVGAGYADQLLSVPGLEGVLAGLTDYTDTTTPLESLSLLMSEG